MVPFAFCFTALLIAALLLACADNLDREPFTSHLAASRSADMAVRSRVGSDNSGVPRRYRCRPTRLEQSGLAAGVSMDGWLCTGSDRQRFGMGGSGSVEHSSHIWC